MRAFLEAENQKMVLVPFHSTAENIAKWIAEELAPVFRGRENVAAMTITLKETEKTSAEVVIDYRGADDA